MPDSQEALLRELLVGQAATQERIESLSRQTKAAQADAREARDLVRRVATILEEQDIKAKLEEMRSEARQGVADLRSDVVNANTNLKREILDLDGRVTELEKAEQRQEGMKTLAGWVMKHMPWLIAAFSAFAAGLGFKGQA